MERGRRFNKSRSASIIINISNFEISTKLEHKLLKTLTLLFRLTIQNLIKKFELNNTHEKIKYENLNGIYLIPCFFYDHTNDDCRL